MDIKVGQVWRDKDKRRTTAIEIIDVFKSDEKGLIAIGLVVGTEEEREYVVERLLKRWELVPRVVEDKKTTIKEPAPKNWQLKVICKHNPDNKLRLTEKIVATYGMPLCACHVESMIFAERREH